MGRENTVNTGASENETLRPLYSAIEIRHEDIRTIADVRDLECVKKVGAAICNLNKVKEKPRLLAVKIEEGHRYFALRSAIKKDQVPFLYLKDGVISYYETSATGPWKETDRLIICNNSKI